VRLSTALLPTAKEVPADATFVSHVLLSRAGYIRRVGAGMFNYLPIGFRVLRKIEAIIRTEMDRAGAQEVLMPALLPAEYFQETGRWEGFGETLFRLKDRKGAEYHLGPTHEEIITDMVRREVKSYRALPLNLYQIQTKFRDEPRPRAGLLRCREFIMKDAYSFDVDEASAKQSYEKMRKAYVGVFDRLGLTYRMVQADSGAMGGSTSAEFQVLVQSGEDFIATSSSSDYAANLEVASALDPREGAAPLPTIPAPEKVATPGKKSIEAVSTFLEASPQQIIKSLVYITANTTAEAGGEREGGTLCLAVVRGDHEVNEIKLARALGVTAVFLATDLDVFKATGAKVGYAGPVGFSGRIVVDRDVTQVADGICGANENGHHLRHVQFGRDFQGEVADLRNVVDGDKTPDGQGTFKIFRGIEGGHIFILGTHYSQKMGATYLGEDGTAHPIVMGCYGIGVSRLLATIVEQHHDDDGIVWPMAVAPYQVHLVTLGKGDELMAAAEKLHQDLVDAGVDVLWDDRDERPGVKFKDADLIGIPLRCTLGEKGLAAGVLEVKSRKEKNAKVFESLPLDGVAEALRQRIQAELSGKPAPAAS
jgi:prolyl-tRNA synthetase